MKEFLEIKYKIKKKKPNFIRQDAHKKAEISKKWRRPKGIHSKMRLKKKGYRRCVSKGWGSPSKARHLHKSGLMPVIVNSETKIDKIDPQKQGAVISASVGIKKKILLLKKSKEKNVKVLNVKNIDEFIKKIEDRIKKRIEEKKQKKKEKESKKKKEKEKKKEEKDKLAEKVMTEEEKTKQAKEEKDKVLTKKDAV